MIGAPLQFPIKNRHITADADAQIRRHMTPPTGPQPYELHYNLG
jgi:hypothetical protein